MDSAKRLISETYDKAKKIWDWSFIFSAILVISMSIAIDVEINKVTIPGSEQFIRSWNDIMRNVYSIFLAIIITWKFGMSYCNSIMGVSESKEEEQAGLADWMIAFVRLLTFFIYGGTITLYIFMLRSNEFQYVKDTNVGILIITSLTIISLIFVFSFGVSIDLWIKARQLISEFKVPKLSTLLFTKEVKPKNKVEEKKLLDSQGKARTAEIKSKQLEEKYKNLQQKHKELKSEHEELKTMIAQNENADLPEPPKEEGINP